MSISMNDHNLIIHKIYIRIASLFKRLFICWTSAAQFPNRFVCILDIIFADPVKLKENN